MSVRVIQSPWTLPHAAASTHPFQLRSGHTVQLWCPASCDPHLWAWYEPAAALCRSIRSESEWQLRLEDCHFVGRVQASGAPALWLYRHGPGDGEVLVDLHGQPYVPRDDRRRKFGYRFEPITARRAAIELGLHAIDEAHPTSEERWPAAVVDAVASGGQRGGTVIPFRRRR